MKIDIADLGDETATQLFRSRMGRMSAASSDVVSSTRHIKHLERYHVPGLRTHPDPMSLLVYVRSAQLV